MVLHGPLTEADGVAERALHLRVLPDTDIAYLHLQKCAVKELASICGVIVARLFRGLVSSGVLVLAQLSFETGIDFWCLGMISLQKLLTEFARGNGKSWNISTFVQLNFPVLASINSPLNTSGRDVSKAPDSSMTSVTVIIESATYFSSLYLPASKQGAVNTVPRRSKCYQLSCEHGLCTCELLSGQSCLSQISANHYMSHGRSYLVLKLMIIYAAQEIEHYTRQFKREILDSGFRRAYLTWSACLATNIQRYLFRAQSTHLFFHTSQLCRNINFMSKILTIPLI